VSEKLDTVDADLIDKMRPPVLYRYVIKEYIICAALQEFFITEIVRFTQESKNIESFYILKKKKEHSVSTISTN